MLAGCGGSQPPIGAAPATGTRNVTSGQHTFRYTAGAQDFRVPAHVTQITVVARGAKGAGSPVTYGGRVSAVIPVSPGEQLVVFVGGDGSGMNGGFNGGANGGASYDGSPTGYGVGGASDVGQHGDRLADRILVSGGGGGQGGGGGGGGMQRAGGSGGFASDCVYDYGGANGMLLAGGAGGAGEESSSGDFGGPGGGGGGGGYYGGGGGGAGGNWELRGLCYASGGGGGGGSSHAERNATNVHMWQGWKNPASNGLVVFSW